MSILEIFGAIMACSFMVLLSGGALVALAAIVRAFWRS